jgi:hypothetical protein
MEGAYRLEGAGSGELVERFVAAPGPAGWRYFGRQFPAANGVGDGEERLLIDHVVDNSWNLVRLRLAAPIEEIEVVATPGEGGIHVVSSGPEWEREATVPTASVAWSPSPSALLVADRLSRTTGGGEMVGAVVDPVLTPHGVSIAFGARGSSGGEEITLLLGGEAMRCRIGPDMPLWAEGWFELLARSG